MARVYLEQEDGKKLHLSGDGRCDTPGFSAKYCHYTLMLDDTKEIIHTELLQSTEAGSSVAMEPLGFKRGMKEIMGDGLDIEVMTTDRSTLICKIMREEFPNVQHEFDIWHTAKGLRKKIQRKGAIKGNEILAAWSRSIINHMCFTCATSKGDAEILKCRWQSILHHVCNEHEWTEDDGQTNRCGHHPLTAQEQSKRQWMKRESSAFENLESLVNDKRLLKDLEQMALFKHTEFIIVLLISWNTLQNHSVMIMFSFSYSFHFLFYCIQGRWRSFTVQCSSTSQKGRDSLSRE
ncbi:uncharacterized protein LOC130371601 [Gadus chalcogrammus]|uniref:uncharacterized protein LOC130371601 n=1 Tax=Gadus chalcogrammus TaxID=1042646 RepID=UPI0024C47476|nr:uncharacterized protein LOC130371601 [Gadus chalcogrammus]